MSWLLLLAGVVTVVAIVVGGYFAWREQQTSKRSYVDELDDRSYVQVDLETPEHEVYEKMAAAYEMDPPRVTCDQLSGALLRRAMAIVPYIERVERDRPSVHRLSSNSYIPASIVGELEEAELVLEKEIKDVQAIAERLRPGWGRGVYAQAYDFVRKQRAQGEEECARQAAAAAAQPARKSDPGAAAAAAAAAKQALPAATQPASASVAAPNASAGPANPAGAPPGFAWSQTAEEVELALAVPAGTRPRDVEVKFGAQSCRIAIRAGAPVVSGTLAHKVNAAECTWSLVGEGEARKLQVTLFKQLAAEWSQLMA